MLLRRLLALEYVTRFHDGRWIDRDVSFVDVPNDPFFIDQEGGAISKAILLVKDTIVLDYSAFEITEEWKRYSNLLCEFAVGGNTVYTQAENLSFVRFEFGDISLIRLQFLRSTACKRQYINRQYDVFLSFEVAKLVALSVSGTKREIRGGVADLQVCLDRRCLLGQCGDAEHGEQHKAY